MRMGLAKAADYASKNLAMTHQNSCSPPLGGIAGDDPDDNKRRLKALSYGSGLDESLQRRTTSASYSVAKVTSLNPRGNTPLAFHATLHRFLVIEREESRQ